MENKVNKLLKAVPEEIKIMVSKAFDITEQILDILDKKKMSQKDLADKLGKRESEISKWMKGTHNFTLETLSKIEIALGEKIIDTPKNFERDNVDSIIHEYMLDNTKKFDIIIQHQSIHDYFRVKGNNMCMSIIAFPHSSNHPVVPMVRHMDYDVRNVIWSSSLPSNYQQITETKGAGEIKVSYTEEQYN